MTSPFLGEIRVFGFNFNPRGWAFCNGGVLAIAQNTALFSILGTTYGGNGQTTFALPDLRGRVAIGPGQGPGLSPQSLGQTGGTETVTLSPTQMPQHNHVLNAATLSPANAAQNVAAPTAQAYLGLSSPNNLYIDPVAPNTTLINSSVAATGGGQAHENRQPYLAVNFCIAVQGIFPSRN
jgi:microcystin-dependent protein